MHLHPDICPSCKAKPYPQGITCANCGFVGAELDQYQKLRNRVGWWPILIVPLTFVVVLGIFFAMILR